MNAKSERMQILEMIESGRISASQGLALLQALAEAETEPEEATFSDELPAPENTFIDYGTTTETADDRAPAGQVETGWERLETPAATPAPSLTDQPSYDGASYDDPPSYEGAPAPTGLPPDTAKWRRWWAIPLVVGAAIAFWGGLFMYLSLRSAGGLSLWFLCAAAPFALGLLVMVLAFQSRTAPWIHLRVQQKPGEWPSRIAISLPLLVGPITWCLHTFSRYIPEEAKENSLEDILQAVSRGTTSETPIYIEVDEGDSGDKVEIYIG